MQPHWAYSCYACRTECSCRWWHPKQLQSELTKKDKQNKKADKQNKQNKTKQNKTNKQTNKTKQNKTKQNKQTKQKNSGHQKHPPPQHLDKLDFFVGQKSHVERERRDQMPQHDCNCMHVLPLLRVVQLPRLQNVDKIQNLREKPRWWLNQSLWKICSSKWESSPNRGLIGGENKKYLKPPPSFISVENNHYFQERESPSLKLTANAPWK